MIFEKKGMVLDLGVATEWDDVSALAPTVIYKDNLYKMFYTGYDGSNYRIGLATSPDGETFTKQGKILDIGAGGEWDDVGVSNCCVIYKDNLYYMYYYGYDGSIFNIGLATSTDGVNFTKQGIVINPSLTLTVAYLPFLNASAIYKDNLFYIYYQDNSGGWSKLYLATSPDGVTFTKQGKILDIGAGGEWDDVQVICPAIVYKDNLYKMFYTGYDGSNYRIGLATSPDGETFTKQGKILDLGAGGEWDDLYSICPAIVYKDNLYKLFYAGHCGSNYRIGLAVSGCEPLRPHEFRANAATGDMNFPLGLNDGTWG